MILIVYFEKRSTVLSSWSFVFLVFFSSSFIIFYLKHGVWYSALSLRLFLSAFFLLFNRQLCIYRCIRCIYLLILHLRLKQIPFQMDFSKKSSAPNGCTNTLFVKSIGRFIIAEKYVAVSSFCANCCHPESARTGLVWSNTNTTLFSRILWPNRGILLLYLPFPQNFNKTKQKMCVFAFVVPLNGRFTGTEWAINNSCIFWYSIFILFFQ